MRWKQFLTPVKNMEAGEAGEYMSEHREGIFTLLDVRQPTWRLWAGLWNE